MLKLFDFDFLMSFARENKRPYTHAAPFPYITIDQVGNQHLSEKCSRAFPPVSDGRWFTYPAEDRTQKNKQVIWDVAKMPNEVLVAILALNSAPFIRFLEELTGIRNLISDPSLYGGGMHQLSNDGMLEVHVDCDFNPRLRLYRRVTVLWYLSPWRGEYKGNIELWKGVSNKGEERLTKCVKSIVSDFNRMVIFTNSETSYHGHPTPIHCPPGVTRKSLATYYFSSEPDPSYSTSKHHKARFIPLPNCEIDLAMTLFRKERATYNPLSLT